MHVLRSAVALCALLTPSVAQMGQATFEITFASTWSAATHPIDFPPQPHFSGLIGATHDASTSFWQLGGIASWGMENMAELGTRSHLLNEINREIASGGADVVLWGPGLWTSPWSATYAFTCNATHPRFTLVSMLAPSPDWFVGVSSYDLRPNGVWVDDVTIPLEVYDAGTDSGPTYLSPNADQHPQVPIARLTTGPFAMQPRVVGSFRVRRIDSTLVYGCANPAGSLTVAGLARLGQTVDLTLDDPAATITAPAQSVVLVAASPDPAFPCGTLALDWGELLVSAVIASIPGPAWIGAGVGVPLGVPTDTGLIGQRFYVQGALVDAVLRVRLTDAAELFVGT